MGIKIELFDGRVLEQERIVARQVRNIMEFYVKAEQKDKDGVPVMSELEAMEGMVKMVCSFFPKEKTLEDYLWDNYTIDELVELCQATLAQTMGGTEDTPSNKG